MARTVCAKPGREVAVDLYHVQLAPPGEQREGQGAASRADLHHELAGLRRNGVHDTPNHRLIMEEVLPEPSARMPAASRWRRSARSGAAHGPGRCAGVAPRGGRASSRASVRADSRLECSARPVPAMSRAVPWSTDVRTKLSPRVTLTALSETGVLEHRQPLVVVHRDHDVGAGESLAGERGVGGDGASDIDPLRTQRLHRGRDRLDLLATQMPAFAGMRIEPADHDAGGREGESGTQVVRDHADEVDQHRGVDGVGHCPQRQVGGGERDSELRGAEHHDRAWAAVQFGEQLGVAGERDPGVVDDALVHRRGHEPGHGAVATRGDRRPDALDHVGAVRRVQSSGNDAARRGHRNHGQLAWSDRLRGGHLRAEGADPDIEPEHFGPVTEHVRVREGDERFASCHRRGQRDVGTDSGRFSRGQRGRACGHSSSRYST